LRVIVAIFTMCCTVFSWPLDRGYAHFWTHDEVREIKPDRPDLVGCPWWWRPNAPVGNNLADVGEKPLMFRITVNPSSHWTNIEVCTDLRGEWTRLCRARTHKPREYVILAPAWDFELTDVIRSSPNMFIKSSGATILKWELIDGSESEIIWERKEKGL
jgi:hypothetical protein